MNAWNGVALRCVGPGQTVGTSVCVCAWIWQFYWWSMQYEVVIAPSPSSCAVQIHHDDGSALIFVGWICIWDGCRVDPGRTERTCVCLNLNVLFVFNAVWGRNLTLMRYFICCPNTLQWRWRLCIDLRWLNIWNGCRVGQTVRTFELLCALEFERVIIGVWSSMLWDHNLTLVRCPNSLNYNGDYGSALIFVGWMYGTVSCWHWTNSAYVCIAVWCVRA